MFFRPWEDSEVPQNEPVCEPTTKRHVFCKTCKQIIFNVHRHCVQMNVPAPITDTAKIVGIPRTSVGSILRTGLSTPKKRKNKRIPLSKMNDFECDVVRRTIYSFYTNKKNPTLDLILEDLLAKTNFPYKRTTLRNVLIKFGFKFETHNKRKVLLESLQYQVWRYKYITTLRKARREGRNIVYLDEAWYDTHDTIKKGWADCSCSHDLDVPSQGKRIIIINAGSQDGWVDNALMLSDSSADYHYEMNATLFEKWFEEQLLPNVPPNSLIVMDNAAYHSRLSVNVPSTCTKKSDIINFMNLHNLPIPNPMPTNPILVDIVKKAGIKKKYFIDELATLKGFQVVRLPSFHCIFNPIEQVWSKVKHDIRTSNCKPTDAPAICQIIRDVIKNVTPDMWKKYVDHVIKVENEYFVMDTTLDDVGSLTINTGDNDSDTSSDEE